MNDRFYFDQPYHLMVTGYFNLVSIYSIYMNPLPPSLYITASRLKVPPSLTLIGHGGCTRCGRRRRMSRLHVPLQITCPRERLVAQLTLKTHGINIIIVHIDVHIAASIARLR